MFGDVFGRFRGWFRVYVEEMFGEGFETFLVWGDVERFVDNLALGKVFRG